jgi:hypothetical protein
VGQQLVTVQCCAALGAGDCRRDAMQAAVRMAGLRSPGLVRCRVQLRRHSSSGGGGGGGGSPRKAPSEQPSSGEPDTAFRAGSRAAIEQLEKIARGEAKSRFSVADYALLGMLCTQEYSYAALSAALVHVKAYTPARLALLDGMWCSSCVCRRISCGSVLRPLGISEGDTVCRVRR